jgi:hypothetical protein
LQRVGRNRFIAPLTYGRSRFAGRDRTSWPLVGNVQQAIGSERRNKAIAPYALHPKQIIIFVTAITPGILIF